MNNKLRTHYRFDLPEYLPEPWRTADDVGAISLMDNPDKPVILTEFAVNQDVMEMDATETVCGCFLSATNETVCVDWFHLEQKWSLMIIDSTAGIVAEEYRSVQQAIRRFVEKTGFRNPIIFRHRAIKRQEREARQLAASIARANNDSLKPSESPMNMKEHPLYGLFS